MKITVYLFYGALWIFEDTFTKGLWCLWIVCFFDLFWLFLFAHQPDFMLFLNSWYKYFLYLDLALCVLSNKLHCSCAWKNNWSKKTRQPLKATMEKMAEIHAALQLISPSRMLKGRLRSSGSLNMEGQPDNRWEKSSAFNSIIRCSLLQTHYGRNTHF